MRNMDMVDKPAGEPSEVFVSLPAFPEETFPSSASIVPGDDSTAKRHLVEMLSRDDIDSRVMQRGVRIIYIGQECKSQDFCEVGSAFEPHSAEIVDYSLPRLSCE